MGGSPKQSVCVRCGRECPVQQTHHLLARLRHAVALRPAPRRRCNRTGRGVSLGQSELPTRKQKSCAAHCSLPFAATMADDGNDAARKWAGAPRKREEDDPEDVEVADEDKPEAAKKKKVAPSAAAEADKVICNLGARRRVTVNTYKGTVFVNIREFYEKDGKQLPGAKGIALSVEQWEELVKHCADVSAEVARRTGAA